MLGEYYNFSETMQEETNQPPRSKLWRINAYPAAAGLKESVLRFTIYVSSIETREMSP
jgi:hypothetical protein